MYAGKHGVLAVLAITIAALPTMSSSAQAQLFGRGGLIGGTVGQILHEGVEKPVGQALGSVHVEQAPSSAPSPDMGPCTPTKGRACDNAGQIAN